MTVLLSYRAGHTSRAPLLLFQVPASRQQAQALSHQPLRMLRRSDPQLNARAGGHPINSPPVLAWACLHLHVQVACRHLSLVNASFTPLWSRLDYNRAPADLPQRKGRVVDELRCVRDARSRMGGFVRNRGGDRPAPTPAGLPACCLMARQRMPLHNQVVASTWHAAVQLQTCGAARARYSLLGWMALPAVSCT